MLKRRRYFELFWSIVSACLLGLHTIAFADSGGIDTTFAATVKALEQAVPTLNDEPNVVSTAFSPSHMVLTMAVRKAPVTEAWIKAVIQTYLKHARDFFASHNKGEFLEPYTFKVVVYQLNGPSLFTGMKSSGYNSFHWVQSIDGAQFILVSS